MKLVDLVENANFTFKETSRGYHHGQHDLAIVAYNNDDVAGWIDYAVYENEPSIQMIEVKDQYKRLGLAKQMLMKLQNKYPEQEIDWGSLTADGSKLYNSMKWKQIPGPGYETYKSLQAWKEKQNELEKVVAPFLSSRKPMSDASEELQQAINDYFDLSNDIHDATDLLQRYDQQVYYKIMIG